MSLLLQWIYLSKSCGTIAVESRSSVHYNLAKSCSIRHNRPCRDLTKPAWWRNQDKIESKLLLFNVEAVQQPNGSLSICYRCVSAALSMKAFRVAFRFCLPAALWMQCITSGVNCPWNGTNYKTIPGNQPIFHFLPTIPRHSKPMPHWCDYTEAVAKFAWPA